MQTFNEPAILGRTGLSVGRLGISSSFGAPTEAFEEAFERGCNYFVWGTFIKGRSSKMAQAIRNIVRKGGRDRLVIAVFAYSHSRFLTDLFLKRGLKQLGVEAIDVLLLGYYPKRPRQGLIDGALELKEKGLIRHIGLSGHHRELFPKLAEEKIFDLFHIRYNAAHRGAEKDIFPYIKGDDRPGIVSFTATRWKRLLNPGKMPPGEPPLTAQECYRFVLSNPSVDVCMMGAADLEQMRENLGVLDAGPVTGAEMERVRRIGDYLYRKRTDG